MSRRFSRVPCPASRLRGLREEALVTLVALGQFVDPDGQCYPSLARLADATGLSRPKICRAISKLEAAGLVRKLRDGPRGVNHYRIGFAEVLPDEGTSGAPPPGNTDAESVPPRGNTLFPEEGTENDQSVPPGGTLTREDSNSPGNSPEAAKPKSPSQQSRRKPEIPCPADDQEFRIRALAILRAKRPDLVARVGAMLDRFKVWHDQHDLRYRNWDARWRWWIGKEKAEQAAPRAHHNSNQSGRPSLREAAERQMRSADEGDEDAT